MHPHLRAALASTPNPTSVDVKHTSNVSCVRSSQTRRRTGGSSTIVLADFYQIATHFTERFYHTSYFPVLRGLESEYRLNPFCGGNFTWITSLRRRCATAVAYGLRLSRYDFFGAFFCYFQNFILMV